MLNSGEAFIGSVPKIFKSVLTGDMKGPNSRVCQLTGSIAARYLGFTMASRYTPISETLRRTILESGETTTAIEEATGVSNTVLSRFLRGERTLTLPTVDRLAKHFKLDLVKRKGGS